MKTLLHRIISNILSLVMIFNMIPMCLITDVVASESGTSELLGIETGNITATEAIFHITNSSGYGNPVASYLVLPASEATPALTDVTGSGNLITDFMSGTATSADVTVSDLEAGTDYVFYVVVLDFTDQSGSTHSDIISLPFSTAEESGKTELLGIETGNITATEAIFHITNSSGYGNPVASYLVLPASEATPALTDVTGSGNLITDFMSGTATSADVTVSDLEAGTDYVFYVVVLDFTDQSGSTHSDIISLPFSTAEESGNIEPSKNVIRLAYTNENGEKFSVDYADYEKAFAEMNKLHDSCSDVTVSLLKDIEVAANQNQTSVIEITRTCVFDLAGHCFSITSSSDTNGIYIHGIDDETDVTFTLKSSVESGELCLLSNLGNAIELGSTLTDKVHFIMESGRVTSKNVNNGSSEYAVTMRKACDAVIQDGFLNGSINVTGNLSIYGGEIESSSSRGVVMLTGAGKISMRGGSIRNTDTMTDIKKEICAINASNTYFAQEGDYVSISGGTLSSINGPAIYLSNSQRYLSQTVEISGNTKIISENDAAIRFSVTPSNDTCTYEINIGGGVSLEGEKGCIDIMGYRILPEDVLKIKIGEETYFKYANGNLPVTPNSSYVTYPEERVLGVNLIQTGNHKGFYTLAEKSSLKQMIGSKEWDYQYLEDLKTAIQGAKVIYDTGMDEGGYSGELWSPFAEAYEAALLIFNNSNANQLEIDYFVYRLGEAQAAMLEEKEQAVNLSSLPNGTYSVNIEMWTANFSSLSMSNGAVKPEAKLIISENSKGEQIRNLQVDFKPLSQLGYWGSLMQFWLYEGMPVEAKRNMFAGTSKKEVTYLSYQHVNFSSGEISLINGVPESLPTVDNDIRPSSILIELPYIGNTNDENKLYCHLGVDMMRTSGVGDQPAILYIKYSTLKAESVNETLSADTSLMNLLIGGKQTTEAKVLGGSGWTITAESDTPDIASVSMEQGKITVTGLRQGSATITVTASKDGQSSLHKEFTVNVAPTGSTAVKVSGGTVTGGMAQYTVDGNFIVTNESSVYASGDIITIVADHAASGAEITITAAVARTLSAASKSIVVQTAQGIIALNPALMRTVSAQNDDVVLVMRKMDEDEVDLDSNEQESKITSLYELNLKKGGAYGESIRFNGGQATVTVPWSAKYGYAYAVEDGKLEEVLTMTAIEDSASWTTGHFSVWALSRYENLMDEVGIKTGTYSVPITIKQASQPSLDSMANDATGDMVVADVTDSGVTYTMFLKARVGTELGSEPLRGHLLKMWYYAVDDTDREYPIPATVVRTYKDTDMNGKIDTFPREVDVKQEGEPQSQYYIQVYVDAMGTNYQDALVKLDWDRALDDGGKAAREGFEDDLATEQTIKSSDKVSRSDLKKWIDNEFTLLVEGKEDDLSMHFDTKALEEIYNQTDSDVKFVIAQANTSKLTEEQKTAIGGRPVYELAVTSNKDTVTEIKDGEVEITLPYTLQKDEKEDGLAVWFVDEDGGIEKIRFSYSEKDKKITFFTERFGICVIAYDEEQIWVNPFTDVSEEDWSFEAVKYVVQNGLFNGTTETTFSPARTMTRGMLVTVLHRLAGKPVMENTGSFPDVAKDSYCAEAVAWATRNRIVSGYGDGMFRPDNNVTREQMAAILYNYARYKGYDVSLVKGLDAFTDKDLVGSYAVRALQWATANEIINGTTPTTLYPKGDSTRAQVAVVLMRFNEKIAVPAEKAKEDAEKQKKQ